MAARTNKGGPLAFGYNDRDSFDRNVRGGRVYMQISWLLTSSNRSTTPISCMPAVQNEWKKVQERGRRDNVLKERERERGDRGLLFR